MSKWPDVSRLPAGFEAWLVAEATKPEGVTRDAIRLRAKQTCAWRPYANDVAHSNGFGLLVSKGEGGRPVFYFKPLSEIRTLLRHRT
jgi:hypothetical protein